MSPNPWLPVVISIVSVVIALGVQVAAFAYFTGKMKGANDALAAMVARLLARVDMVEASRIEAAQEKGDLGARLEHVEKSTGKIAEIGTALTRLDERFQGFEKRSDERAASERIHLDSLSRQIANLATHGGGELIELPATVRRPRRRDE